MAKPKKDPSTPTSDMLAKNSPARLGFGMGSAKHKAHSATPPSQHFGKKGGRGR